MKHMSTRARRVVAAVALSAGVMAGVPAAASASTEVPIYNGSINNYTYGPRHSLTSVAFTWSNQYDGGVNAIIDGTNQYAGESYFTNVEANNIYVQHPYCGCRLLDGLGVPKAIPTKPSTGYWREYY